MLARDSQNLDVGVACDVVEYGLGLLKGSLQNSEFIVH